MSNERKGPVFEFSQSGHVKIIDCLIIPLPEREEIEWDGKGNCIRNNFVFSYDSIKYLNEARRILTERVHELAATSTNTL